MAEQPLAPVPDRPVRVEMMSLGDNELAVYQAQRSQELELNKAAAAYEHGLMSPLFLLNGGATVAFLTLLGAASSQDSTLKVSIVFGGSAVILWSFGLLVTVLGVRQGYHVQVRYTRATTARRRWMENIILENSPLNAAITPVGPERWREEMESTAFDARRRQDRWLRFSAVALGCFAAGVITAALSVLPLPFALP